MISILSTYIRMLVESTTKDQEDEIHDPKKSYDKKFTKVTFKKPDIYMEWEEAERYPGLFPTIKVWKKIMSKGKTIDVEEMELAGLLNNTDYNNSLSSMKTSFEKMSKDRIDRAEEMFDFSKESIEVELPIIMKHKGEYELIAGNTRLTKMGILHRESEGSFPVKAYLIEV